MVDLAKNIKDKISNYTVRFHDDNLEKEFCYDEIKSDLKFIIPILITLAILFFAFFIADTYLIRNPHTRMIILAIRIISVLVVLILLIKILFSKKYDFYYLWLTFTELLVAVSYIIIVYEYENPDFLIQTFGLILIILSIFMVPNKWINMLLTTSAMVVLFFILYSSRHIKVNQFSAGMVYTIIALILCSIYSYRISFYKRAQYLYSKELYRLSTRDNMTGTLNRMTFEKILEDCVAKASFAKSYFSLIIFDFDDFKKINDEFGHITGDEVLINSTAIIRNILGDRHNLFRWGGEEFAIIMEDADIQVAFAAAGRILVALAGSDFNPVRKVTCSFGVTSYIDGDTPKQLQNRADRFLMMAKQAGKNSVVASVDGNKFLNNYYDESTLILDESAQVQVNAN